MIENALQCLPTDTSKEHIQPLLAKPNVRIERIVSHGQVTEGEWYDQEENEWVMVLEGSGTLIFEDAKIVTLNAGDFINIPAHYKHRVIQTTPDQATIWLAVFYQ